MKGCDYMTINEADIRTIIDRVLSQAAPAAASPSVGCCCEGIPVEVSARHVHVTEEAALALFGSPLTKKRDLSQPGEFLSEQRVKIVTAKGEFANVAVLGPARKQVQVEISYSDCRTLGITAPINLSGDLKNAGDVLLVGPRGIVQAGGSAIIAKAHIHMTPADAARYGVSNGQHVAVRLQSARPATLEDVIIRVSEKYALAMHIDADEANATCAVAGTKGLLLLSASPCPAPAAAQSSCPDSSNSCRMEGKKLITEADARTVSKDIQEIHVPAGVIITPAARDVFTSRHQKIIID